MQYRPMGIRFALKSVLYRRIIPGLIVLGVVVIYTLATGRRFF